MQSGTLIHGMRVARGQTADLDARRLAIRAHAATLGIARYSLFDLRPWRAAGRLLRAARGTAPGFDAIEIFEYEPARLDASLASSAGEAAFRAHVACQAHALDRVRSVLMLGEPRPLVSGKRDGWQIFWFGSGLSELGRAGFIEHYTRHHGPLVAANAAQLGIASYTQWVAVECARRAALCDLGLGAAEAFPVFAQLTMQMPSLSLRGLRERRRSVRAVARDERSHIDFAHSVIDVCRS